MKQSIVIVLFAAIAMMACLQMVVAEPYPEPAAYADPYAEALASPEAKPFIGKLVKGLLGALGKK